MTFQYPNMTSVLVDHFIPHLFSVISTVCFQVVEKKRLGSYNISQITTVLFWIHGVNKNLFGTHGENTGS